MKIKILARVIVYDQKLNKILLVRNKDAQFWYAPGGGWEYEQENIIECAKREVKEEVGIDVNIEKLLYLQEFHESKDGIFFETFWLANADQNQVLNDDHIDLDPNGLVEEARWFDIGELQNLTVFPKRLKDSFWDNIESFIDSEDRFIGVS